MSATSRAETPPHAPEGGWSRRLLGRFHVTGVFWYRFHRWGVSILPDWGVRLCIALFTAFFFVFLRKIRRAIAANLDVVLGPCGFLERQRRIHATMREFAWCLSERYERHATSRQVRIEAEGLENWRAVAGGGRGFILVTAHLGNFEVGSMLPAERGRHVYVVREREVDPRAQLFVAKMLRRAGGANYTTIFEGDDPLQGMKLLDALRRGDIVAVQGDRPRSGGRNVETNLFGRPFPLPAGPAALARAAEVPLLPVFVFRTGRLSYRLAMRPPIEPRLGAGSREAQREIVQAMAREVEWAIREAPHQWFCFRAAFE